MTYLLDTNVCAFLMKGRFPALNRKILTAAPSEVSASSVTLFELEYGATKANWGYQRRENMSLFLSAFQVASFTENDAIAAGRIRAQLERLGSPIGAYGVTVVFFRHCGEGWGWSAGQKGDVPQDVPLKKSLKASLTSLDKRQ